MVDVGVASIGDAKMLYHPVDATQTVLAIGGFRNGRASRSVWKSASRFAIRRRIVRIFNLR